MEELFQKIVLNYRRTRRLEVDNNNGRCVNKKNLL